MFQQIDKDILEKLENRKQQGGSTALCALIRDQKVFIANAGDSKAIVVKKDGAIDLTKEHRASNQEEQLRVENMGGFVIVHKSRYLVQGSLQITRSIGDQKYKQFISCEPDIVEYSFSKDDLVLVMGSDGFWDVTSILLKNLIYYIKY